MKQIYFCFFTLCLILFISVSAKSQKIFPNAVGFGTEFRGAYAGDTDPIVLIVDTLYAGELQTGDHRGSFEWAVKQTFPRIIVFEVGGVIDYSNTDTRYFSIKSPYINIYGQTAPSPGITIKSATIYCTTHDLLMQHIAMRFGDYPKPDGTVQVGDCFGALSGSYNIVLDHCSLSWGTDEILSAYGENFTLSNCLVYEPLHFSYHCNEKGDNEPEPHGFGALVVSPSNVTIYNNLFGWVTNRFPMIQSDKVAYINNYATGYALHGVDISKATGGNNAAIVGNSFYPTPKMTNSKAENFTYWRNGLDTSSKIYMHDNNCKRKDKGYSERECIFSYMDAADINAIFTDDANVNVVDISDYKIVAASDVIDSVLINSGSRPWDRDFYDSLAILNLTNNTQDYINSVLAQPAKAYNLGKYEGLKTTDGNMKDGYDFSANKVSFTVNGQSINLTENTTSQKQVLDALNAQLPSGTVAIDHPNSLCHHIIIQTNETGSTQQIVIGGDASAFGIANGTYKGEDAPYPEYNYSATKTNLDIPENPNDDDNLNGYTNIEEWAYSFCKTENIPDNGKIQVAYLTSNRTMDVSASATDNDAIIRMLKADDKFEVKVFAVENDAVVDFSGYDIAVIQESFGSTSSILKPTGSAGLKNIPIPFIYNKVYALKDGRGITSGSPVGGGEVVGLSITVDASDQSNELFNGISFTNNKFDVFKSEADDSGAAGTKALNYASGINLSHTNTLLGTANEIVNDATAIFLNDFPTGAYIGTEEIKARMIAFGMNFGAICKNDGGNLTINGLTLWRNALYSLAGLEVPTDPYGQITSVKYFEEDRIKVYPNPVNDILFVSSENNIDRLSVFNMQGSKLIERTELQTGIVRIDLNEFKPGIYIVKIESGSNLITKKVIKP